MAKPNNGLAVFHAAMERVKTETRAAAMEALIKGANDVADTQRRLVPVDTGDLRDSITVTLPGQSTPPFSQPGGSRVAAENEVLITAGGEEVRYPHLVEHGSVKMEARPFFFPGYRLTADKVKRSVASAFRRTSLKAWNKR